MSRLPPTYASAWSVLPNPAYAGRTPTPLKAVCHDGTPFVTVGCRCGASMHLHESQTVGIPDGYELASPCRRCGRALVFPAGFFERAFQQLREEGWVE